MYLEHYREDTSSGLVAMVRHMARRVFLVSVAAAAVLGCSVASEHVEPQGSTSQELNLDSAATTQWVVRQGMSAATFQSEYDTWGSAGYRLTSINGYDDQGATRYSALWEKKSGPATAVVYGLTAAEYQAEVTKRAAQGYGPVLVDGYNVSGEVRFAAIFHEGSVPWVARHGMTSAQYQTEFSKNADAGFRLVHVSGYEEGGQAHYAAVWSKSSGPEQSSSHGMTSAQYQAEFARRVELGYVPVHVDGYYVGDTKYFAVIWQATSGSPIVAKHDLTEAQYRSATAELTYQGYRPYSLSAYGNGTTVRYAILLRNLGFSRDDLANIDNVVNVAMSGANVRGLSLAISQNGALKFAKAYGTADAASGAATTTKTRMRWASVSKPITATMIMRLVEQGRLRLTDPVFGNSGVLGNTHRPARGFNSWHLAIRVDHLLQHTSGGWPNGATNATEAADVRFQDPMFLNSTMTANQLISWTLQNRGMIWAPGTHYRYSNFGYCILGRIIERVTGKTYEQAVRDEILTPAGANSFAIGGNTLLQGLAGEAVYYEDGTTRPYGMNVTRMDSHGGWVGTPIDLLRFGVRVDRQSSPADLLSAASIDTMTTRSAVCVTQGCFYARGWGVNSVPNYWHDGALPGERSIFVRAANGMVWAAVVNETHGDLDGDGDTGEHNINLDTMMWNVVGQLPVWPSWDLFSSDDSLP